MKKLIITADRFMNLRNLKAVIKKITEAPYNTLCITTNYSLFSLREGNRNGSQDKRIKNFRKKIAENRFYPLLGHIFVDRKGVIIEGNHRFEACVAEGKPIIFMVIDDMTLDEISDYNTNKISPSWKNLDNFGSAKTQNYELAIIFDDLRLDLISKYSERGLTEKDLTAGEMYGILTEQPKMFGAGVNAVTLTMWKDKTFVEKARTIEFAEILDAYVSLKITWAHNVHKRFKASKAIMECTFAENKKAINFNLHRFVSNLKTSNFRFKDDSGTNDFVREAVRIHNIRQPKNLRAISLVSLVD